MSVYHLIFLILVLLSLYLSFYNERLEKIILEQEKFLEIQLEQINNLRNKLFELENHDSPDIVVEKEHDI